MSVSDDIKRTLIRPAITLIENEWNKHQHHQYKVEPKIWLDVNMPDYYVLIPETLAFDLNFQRHHDIETRKLRYINTGRIYYDASKPHKEAVCFEYILENIYEGFQPVFQEKNPVAKDEK